MNDPVSHYQGEAGRRYHEIKRGVPEAALPWIARLRAAKIQPHVRPDDSVLEYGAGAGWNLVALHATRRIAFDVSEFLRPEVEQRGLEFAGDTRSLADGLADVVICHHALEHLLAPPTALAEMRRLLKPTGHLLVWVPFEDEWRHRRFTRGEKNHHLYSWNPQTLGNLLEECGFHAVNVRLARYGWDRFAAAWAIRLGVGEASFRLLRRSLVLLRPLREIAVQAVKAATEADASPRLRQVTAT